MLHEFIVSRHPEIVGRTRQLIADRSWPLARPDALDNGVPLFLEQVSEILRQKTSAVGSPSIMVGTTAVRHGSDLQALGFSVSQVVYAYGDVCQVITAMAIEERAAISVEEFQILNGCLDDAIADAVTEHARQTAEVRSTDEVERLGRLMHEVRNLLNTASLAYQVLKRGDVAVNGSTGAILGRSLTALTTVVESVLSDVRMAASHQRVERIALLPFLNDVASAGRLHAEHHGQQFSYAQPAAGMTLEIDPQLVAAAVQNLIDNACKYSKAGGHVILRTRQEPSHVAIEVEDQCGGIPESNGDPFRAFGERRGGDRTGLGLGLSIARRAVRASGGEVSVRNRPGHGCVFSIELPVQSDAGTISH